MEILTKQEVIVLGKNNNKNRGVKAPEVNPQGFGQDAEFAEEPKSKLENAAKKKRLNKDAILTWLSLVVTAGHFKK